MRRDNCDRCDIGKEGNRFLWLGGRAGERMTAIAAFDRGEGGTYDSDYDM